MSIYVPGSGTGVTRSYPVFSRSIFVPIVSGDSDRTPTGRSRKAAGRNRPAGHTDRDHDTGASRDHNGELRRH